MKLAEAKERLSAATAELDKGHLAEFHVFVVAGRPLHVLLTGHLRKCARKERIWGSKEMLATLKNAMYGFDPDRPRSRGGADGIFLIDRKHRPPNAMMKKLFDRFLDKPGSGVAEIAEELGVEVESLLPVRLVSHDLRLLGVLSRGETEDTLVLVDCDRGE